jgi:hypothetical protein
VQHLDPQPALIDRAYEQLVEAIADGTLVPGQRIRQEELGRALGVSRQLGQKQCLPISPATPIASPSRTVASSRSTSAA